MLKGRRKGEWQVRIQPVDRDTGKRISWPVGYAATWQKAKSLERAMWRKYEKGLRPKKASDDFCEAFRKFVKAKEGTISPVTFHSWESSLRVFQKYFAGLKIKDITTPTVNKFAHSYVNEHNLTVSKNSTISTKLIHLHSFYDKQIGVSVVKNPVPRNALKTFFRISDFSISEQQYLFSEKELSTIKQKVKADLKKLPVYSMNARLCIWIDAETGMRPGEIQALRFCDLIKENGLWTFRLHDSWSDMTHSFNGSLKARPHGYSRTVLPISDDLADFIHSYEKKQAKFLEQNGLKNSEGLIVVNLRDYRFAELNRPISQSGMNDMLRKICKRLQIDPGNSKLSMYSFRHTICSMLANKSGISYPWAAEKMGHSLSTFMKVYVGVNNDINRQMMQKWAM